MALTLTMEESGEAAQPERPRADSQPAQPARAGLTYKADGRGRRIGFRPLDALLRFRIRRIAGPQDAGNFPVMIDYFSAAVVAEIDGNPESPPRTLQQVEAIISQLGVEGMEVAGLFVLEQIGVTPEMLDQAKNSAPTPN